MEKWICALKIKDFFSTGPVEKIYLFPQADFLTQKEKVFHSFSFHIPQALLIDYRQELIFAVISRMWFCREVSPPARAASTFLMEYRMVV